MITETLAYYGLWLALIIYLNFSQFLFLFLIPLFIVNIVIINIVGLPHNMRPLSGKNLPFETTVSLMAPKVFDFLFMNFSHHVEHHFFPELNHQHLPWVRGYLLKKYPDQFARVDLFRAILLLHQTPRAYFDESHLFYPGTEQKINLRQLAKKEFFSENT